MTKLILSCFSFYIRTLQAVFGSGTTRISGMRKTGIVSRWPNLTRYSSATSRSAIIGILSSPLKYVGRKIRWVAPKYFSSSRFHWPCHCGLTGPYPFCYGESGSWMSQYKGIRSIRRCFLLPHEAKEFPESNLDDLKPSYILSVGWSWRSWLWASNCTKAKNRVRPHGPDS
jgi:hypothetical protein